MVSGIFERPTSQFFLEIKCCLAAHAAAISLGDGPWLLSVVDPSGRTFAVFFCALSLSVAVMFVHSLSLSVAVMFLHSLSHHQKI